MLGTVPGTNRTRLAKLGAQLQPAAAAARPPAAGGGGRQDFGEQYNTKMFAIMRQIAGDADIVAAVAATATAALRSGHKALAMAAGALCHFGMRATFSFRR